MYPKMIDEAKKENHKEAEISFDTVEDKAPDKCPICSSPSKLFKKIK
jgi:rubrerythrin